MIIKTKKHTFMPHFKVALAILILVIAGFGGGYLFGLASGWSQCINLGINFINFDNIVDKELVKSALLQYKSSLGGWAFDSKSPWYVGK